MRLLTGEASVRLLEPEEIGGFPADGDEGAAEG
jgi:hypothetical protein